MRYTIQNDLLSLTVDTHGAEAVSVTDRRGGAELLWRGDESVWGRHAPILFPYTGKLTEGRMIAKGAEYRGGQHGFARDMEHRLARRTGDTLVFELAADPRTLSLWPYDFVLRSAFTLDGNTVRHSLTVENPGEDELRFGIGFHPAFAIPFDGRHTAADYEFRFEREESPLCVSTLPNGLLNGRSYYLGRNIRSIPITDELFQNDSHCMVNLRSRALAVVERDTGRAVSCGIEGCPYVLIWSAASRPVRFVCIEPWYSLPGEEGGPVEWEKRPGAAVLKRGESWTAALSTTFIR